MGAFRDKSDKTFSSGELLLSNTHYNSSVHCFYYSCFQLIIDLLREEYRYTDEQISSGTNNSSSHNNVINQLKSCLINSKINYKFLGNYTIIKDTRIKADYSDENIAEEDAMKIKEEVMKFREELNKIYENGI